MAKNNGNELDHRGKRGKHERLTFYKLVIAGRTARFEEEIETLHEIEIKTDLLQPHGKAQ